MTPEARAEQLLADNGTVYRSDFGESVIAAAIRNAETAARAAERQRCREALKTVAGRFFPWGPVAGELVAAWAEGD